MTTTTTKTTLRTLTLLSSTLLASAATAGEWPGTVHHSVGGGGTGEFFAPHGVWSFDLLTPEQRNAPGNCANTMFNPFGNMLYDHGWQPSSQSNVPPRIDWLDPLAFDEFSTNVGGGVLRFDTPVQRIFVPGHRSVMVTPAIPVELLQLNLGDWLELSFHANSNPVPDTLVFVAGMRIMQDGVWGPWEEQEIPILPGAHPYRVQFGSEVGDAAERVQGKVGVKNNDEKEPAKTEGPAVDKVKVEAKKAEARSWKYIPDISQGDTATCMASAAANCLSWWASNGYPELTSGETQAEKNENLRKDLEKTIYDDNKGDGGISQHLKDKGVYKGQDTENEERPQLEHVRRSGANATWTWMKEQFDAGHDVMLRLQWYKADGTLASTGAHYVTVARVEDGDSKKVRAANPWGETTDTVDDSNKDDAYDTLDVTVDEEGRIRIDNDNLENNAAGVDGADYLCVADINVVRPVSSEYAPATDSLISVAAPLAAGDITTYQYSVTNTMNSPVQFVVLPLDVPFDNVQSPAGWSWTALPAPYPGASGCGNWIGGEGIAWFTFTNPIVSGETLSGFDVDVASGFPFDNLGVMAYLEGTNEGEFLIAPAPVRLAGDVDIDGDVDFADLVALLSAWGPCPAPPAACPADFDGNGAVGFSDLLILLANFGL